MKNPPFDSKEYVNFFNQVKSDIEQTQLRAALSVTHELTNLYWRIGKKLSEKVAEERWGAKTIERFANDIKSSFPSVSGFSYRNLYFMRQFAEGYPEGISETAVSQIPWGHNIMLLQRVDTFPKRLWYAQQTIANGWSRDMLATWIESD